MKLFHVVGNRPQFIKLAPFLRATRKVPSIQNVIIHSGQHYHYEMSEVFFKDLEIPKPDYSLEVGSATHGIQTGKMLIGLDPILLEGKPDVVVVYGDTNTTLAGALAGYKLKIPVAHVEAGMRENIWRPEELNKKMADHCSDFCFCPLERAVTNLTKESIDREKIFFTGDITYDAFLINAEKAKLRKTLPLPVGEYFLLTLHRAETVDCSKKLSDIVNALCEIGVTVAFPCHPRTENRLKEFGLMKTIDRSHNIQLMKPAGSFDFLNLLTNSKLVMTDSSGVIKETFYARKPGVTLDSTTEYQEIFDRGYNILAGTQKNSILVSIENMVKKDFGDMDTSEIFGNGQSAFKMMEVLLEGKK